MGVLPLQVQIHGRSHPETVENHNFLFGSNCTGALRKLWFFFLRSSNKLVFYWWCPQMFARLTVAQLDTHPDRCYSCHNLLLDILGFCPNPNGIQNLDGMEEVVRLKKLVANCLAHEDKRCLAAHHFRNCQDHDARRQPHLVELHQVHFLEVIAGGTRHVKFVLKFLGVEHSPPELVLSDIIAIAIVRNHP